MTDIRTRDQSDLVWPTADEIRQLNGQDLAELWTRHCNHVKCLANKVNEINRSNDQLVTDQQDLKQQLFNAARRENVLVMRLATKQHIIHELEVSLINRID